MPPPVFVNVAARGVTIAPGGGREGCSVRITVGLITVDVAVISRRCLFRRYCADVTAMTSGSGCTVTVVNSGAETAPPVFVAVMVRLMTTGLIVPGTSVGAVAVTVAVDGPVEGAARPTSAGAPACVTAKVSASAGTFGSMPLTGSTIAAPEKTVIGATWFTVGVAAGLMAIVVDDETVFEQASVTVSVAATGVVAPIAEKTPFAALAGVTVPLDTVQRNVSGAP